MSPSLYFIDANIPMYAVGKTHPLKQICLDILEACADGRINAITNSEVLQEILHRYTALGERRRAIEVAQLFMQVVPNVLPVTKEDISLALNLHEEYARLTARDAVHAAVMRNNKITHLISADEHFDEVNRIKRTDPTTFTRPL